MARTHLPSGAEHYNRERQHQGIGNRRVDRELAVRSHDGAVIRRARLGGLLNFCRLAAA
jgi:hypothetical protein